MSDENVIEFGEGGSVAPDMTLARLGTGKRVLAFYDSTGAGRPLVTITEQGDLILAEGVTMDHAMRLIYQRVGELAQSTRDD